MCVVLFSVYVKALICYTLDFGVWFLKGNYFVCVLGIFKREVFVYGGGGAICWPN